MASKVDPAPRHRARGRDAGLARLPAPEVADDGGQAPATSGTNADMLNCIHHGPGSTKTLYNKKALW